MGRMIEDVKEYPGRLKRLGMQTAAALLIGAVCGLLGTLFHIAVHQAEHFRLGHPWMIWLMPAAGLLIVAVYKLTQAEGHGTDSVVRAAQEGDMPHMQLIPAIFIGTVLTHLTGGSAGREGAALQMGGQVGYYVGRLLRYDSSYRRDCVICGMAAFFSALFGTPLGATVFALCVVHVGMMVYDNFLQTLIAAVTAYLISLSFHVEPTRFHLSGPKPEPVMLLRVLVLGALCAVPTILFCRLLHEGEALAEKLIENAWIRVLAGSALIIVFTLIYGSQRYSGTGMSVIVSAVENGRILPWDWILKIVLTVLSMSFGFRGGEVVPSFFIGAAFGCWIGPFLGIPAGFAAAVGLASVFCGCTNCLMATLVLCVEMFGGGDAILYLALACGANYILSGRVGFYRTQALIIQDADPNTIHHMQHPY